MNFINRSNNIINHKNDLILLKTFRKFPVFMGCVSHGEESDQFADMNFFISESTGIIQLNPILPLDLIYQASHGSGTVGKSWNLHHKEFSEFINHYDPVSVFEIGGGSGILSNIYKNNFKNIDWTILEPNPKNIINANIIEGFFDENFTYNGIFDSVVHSHVLEHVFYPGKFLSDISNLMKPSQKMFFSVPNLKEMFKKYYTNCINFEHTILLTEEYIDYMLCQNKFKILSKKYFLSDHSIFYATQRDDSIIPGALPLNGYLVNKELFCNYTDYFDRLIINFNSIIRRHCNKEIYLFGGHVFSQFLINRGLDTSKIKSILDNDSNKHGKRLYGSSLIVESSNVLIGKNNPCVILKAANYTDEIKHDIIKNINSTTLFVE